MRAPIPLLRRVLNRNLQPNHPRLSPQRCRGGDLTVSTASDDPTLISSHSLTFVQHLRRRRGCHLFLTINSPHRREQTCEAFGLHSRSDSCIREEVKLEIDRIRHCRTCRRSREGIFGCLHSPQVRRRRSLRNPKAL